MTGHVADRPKVEWPLPGEQAAILQTPQKSPFGVSWRRSITSIRSALPALLDRDTAKWKKAMNLNENEIALLSNTDDDFYGLWEVDWYFNGAHSEWSRKTRTAFLSDFVQRGLIELFFGPLMTEKLPLTPQVAAQVLVNPTAWAPPANGQEAGYYVTTSFNGIALLRQQQQ